MTPPRSIPVDASGADDTSVFIHRAATTAAEREAVGERGETVKQLDLY